MLSDILRVFISDFQNICVFAILLLSQNIGWNPFLCKVILHLLKTSSNHIQEEIKVKYKRLLQNFDIKHIGNVNQLQTNWKNHCKFQKIEEHFGSHIGHILLTKDWDFTGSL